MKRIVSACLVAIALLALLGSCKESPVNAETEIVYITDSGNKYHKSGCRYLSESKISITLSAACSQGYTPCSVCKPPSCK